MPNMTVESNESPNPVLVAFSSLEMPAASNPFLSTSALHFFRGPGHPYAGPSQYQWWDLQNLHLVVGGLEQSMRLFVDFPLKCSFPSTITIGGLARLPGSVLLEEDDFARGVER